eukprot:SAG31_NODE_2144_length_6341_cov_59.535085_3_plen_96_part_00
MEEAARHAKLIFSASLQLELDRTVRLSVRRHKVVGACLDMELQILLLSPRTPPFFVFSGSFFSLSGRLVRQVELNYGGYNNARSSKRSLWGFKCG